MTVKALDLFCSFDDCQTEVFITDVIQSIYFPYLFIHVYCCMVFLNFLSIISAINVVTGRVFDTGYDSVLFIC